MLSRVAPKEPRTQQLGFCRSQNPELTEQQSADFQPALPWQSLRSVRLRRPSDGGATTSRSRGPQRPLGLSAMFGHGFAAGMALPPTLASRRRSAGAPRFPQSVLQPMCMLLSVLLLCASVLRPIRAPEHLSRPGDPGRHRFMVGGLCRVRGRLWIEGFGEMNQAPAISKTRIRSTSSRA